MADDVWGFDESSMRKLVESYRQLMRMFTNQQRQLEALLSRHASDWKPAHIYICKTDDAIPAMTVVGSNYTPGEGLAAVYRLSEGKLIDTGKVIDVLNISTTEISADTFIQVKQELASHRFIIDFEDCSAS